MNKEDAEKMLNKNSILCEHGDDIIVRIKNGNYLQILVNFRFQFLIGRVKSSRSKPKFHRAIIVSIPYR